MWIVIGIVALAISFAINWYGIQRITAMEARKGKEYWLKVGLFYVLMLLGMLAREAYNMLVSGKPFNWVSIAIAAIVSPMIFGAVYGSIGSLDIDVPSIVLAFQNGFFWNSIFEGLGPEVSGS